MPMSLELAGMHACDAISAIAQEDRVALKPFDIHKNYIKLQNF